MSYNIKNIINTANEFFSASTLCFTNDETLWSPWVTTMSFSCELYLKAILISNGQTEIKRKGHSIKKLFNALPEYYKEVIKRKFDIDDNHFSDKLTNIDKQRLTTRSIQNVIKKYVIKAGLNSENISTHKLRHTSATLMYKYGHVDIRSLQQILGHESIGTTEIYTHVDDSLLQSAVNSNPLALMFN